GFLLFPIGDRRCNRTRASVGNAGGNARPSLTNAKGDRPRARPKKVGRWFSPARGGAYRLRERRPPSRSTEKSWPLVLPGAGRRVSSARLIGGRPGEKRPPGEGGLSLRGRLALSAERNADGHRLQCLARALVRVALFVIALRKRLALVDGDAA